MNKPNFLFLGLISLIAQEQIKRPSPDTHFFKIYNTIAQKIDAQAVQTRKNIQENLTNSKAANFKNLFNSFQANAYAQVDLFERNTLDIIIDSISDLDKDEELVKEVHNLVDRYKIDAQKILTSVKESLNEQLESYLTELVKDLRKDFIPELLNFGWIPSQGKTISLSQAAADEIQKGLKTYSPVFINKKTSLLDIFKRKADDFSGDMLAKTKKKFSKAWTNTKKELRESVTDAIKDAFQEGSSSISDQVIDELAKKWFGVKSANEELLLEQEESI
jgi:hypothetical protein